MEGSGSGGVRKGNFMESFFSPSKDKAEVAELEDEPRRFSEGKR